MVYTEWIDAIRIFSWIINPVAARYRCSLCLLRIACVWWAQVMSGMPLVAVGVVNHAIAAHRRWSSICLAKNTGLCAQPHLLLPHLSRFQLNPRLYAIGVDASDVFESRGSMDAAPPILHLCHRGFAPFA